MAQSRTRRAEAAASAQMQVYSRRQLLSVLAAVAALVLAGWIGWQLHGPGGHPTVRVEKSFTGTITMVNDTHDAGCVTPAGGKALCSVFAPVAGTTVSQGARVSAAREWIRSANGSSSDLLLLYPAR